MMSLKRTTTTKISHENKKNSVLLIEISKPLTPSFCHHLRFFKTKALMNALGQSRVVYKVVSESQITGILKTICIFFCENVWYITSNLNCLQEAVQIRDNNIHLHEVLWERFSELSSMPSLTWSSNLPWIIIRQMLDNRVFLKK